MATAEAGRVVVRLEGKDVGLTQLLDKIEKQFDQGKAKIQSYEHELAQLGPQITRLESNKLAYARALALVAEKQGRAGEAAHLLASELGKVAPNSVAAQRALLQLQQTLDRQKASTEAAKNATSNMLTNFAGGFNKLLGAYFAVSQVTQGIGALIEAGNQLEKTQATFKALSVTPEEYAKNLAIAKEQQQTFGGSLQENLDQMSGFIFTARNAGVSLQELTNLARKLAIIDPAQGFKGASIALKEFFSGDITSLARRFELPRDMLHGIDDLATGEEKIAALTAQLEKMGITNELIAAQANTTAVEYDKMLGTIQDAVAGTGQVLASVLLPALQGIGNAWKGIVGDTSNIQQLANLEQKSAAVAQSFLTNTTTLDQFNAKIQEYNTMLVNSGQATDTWSTILAIAYNPLRGIGEIITENKLKLEELTPVQYAYAQALLATGVPISEVITKLSEYGPKLEEVNVAYRQFQANNNASTQQLNDFSNALAQLASMGPAGAAAALTLANTFKTSEVNIVTATGVLQQHIVAIQADADAKAANTAVTQESINTTALFTQELTNNAVEAINNQVQTEALKVAQERLYNTALAAASGTMEISAALRILQGELGLSTQQAYGLINALSQLQRAKALEAAGLKSEPLFPGHAFNSKTYQGWIDNKKAIEEATKAEQAYRRSAGSTADQLAYAQKELDAATENTKEYWEALKRVEDLQERQDRESKRGKGGAKGGGSPKLTANEKLNNQLLAQEDKFNNQLEDAEEKHMQNLVKIYEDYNKKILEQQKKNEISKRRSRASFYESNTDLPEGLDPSKYAAQYEQAFVEAQKIAQEGSAQLANEYLEMRQQQIEELRKLDEEAAKIQADENLSDKEKEAALSYLEGRRKLIEDAQAEELKQLLEGGDAINKELSERLSEEEQMYADQTAKIIENSDRAADAKIKNAERSKIAVDAENRALAEQAARMDTIAQKSAKIGYKPDVSQPTVPPPAIPQGQPQSTPNANNIIIGPDTVIMVKQLEMWQVFDQAVVNTLSDMAARLEIKIDGVAQAVNDAKSAISSGLGNVERAISRIKGRVVE